MAVAGGKGEIEEKLENFVKEAFEKYGINLEGGSMNKTNARELIKDLMVEQKVDEAWDETEFDRMFDLFQEDEGGDESLDKGEFTKLVTRMAQL